MTLPRSYHRDIVVKTSDADDEGHHNRGNVCVAGLPGSLEVDVDFGQVFVSLDEDITPAPSCGPALLAECDAADWDDSCGCAEEFGRVSVRSEEAATAFIDIPPALWASVSLTGDSACMRSVNVEGFDNADEGGRLLGSLNAPAPDKEAFGYTLSTFSEKCATVLSTERPMLTEPEETIDLGDASICQGCVRSSPCSQLLPGG